MANDNYLLLEAAPLTSNFHLNPDSPKYDDFVHFVNLANDTLELNGNTIEEKSNAVFRKYYEQLGGYTNQFRFVDPNISIDVNYDDVARVITSDLGRKSDIIDQAINNVSDAGQLDTLTQKRLDFILEQLDDGQSYSQTFAEYKVQLPTIEMADFSSEAISQETSESYQEAVTAADNLMDLSNQSPTIEMADFSSELTIC